ncbi:hypothetical protein TeGR_g1761 [Tetraparma gracilis]|uniref:F-box domain-containing protein n=2 Tax=Tetraparma gracilis TaxID=2962635 RepID=A0ABQ6N7C3_9STRA|nr:hypothetical protein TeGR_g1761 [Tetraparma gracilis]
MLCQGAKPTVPYADVVAFPATLGIDSRCIITSSLTEDKYNAPSAGKKKPGDGRRNFIGQVTANLLKCLQGTCGCGCGLRIDTTPADAMNALALDHEDEDLKTTDGSLLFRCNLDVTQSDATKRDNAIKTMAEVRTLSVKTVGHHQHTKPGGKLVARRSRKAVQSHRGALYLAAAAATAPPLPLPDPPPPPFPSGTRFKLTHAIYADVLERRAASVRAAEPRRYDLSWLSNDSPVPDDVVSSILGFLKTEDVVKLTALTRASVDAANPIRGRPGPCYVNIDQVLATDKGKKVIAFHNKALCQGVKPTVPYADVVAFPATLGIDSRCIITSSLTEAKYNAPSAGKKKPGGGRQAIIAQITANLMKCLQGTCGCGCGLRIDTTPADAMKELALDHEDEDLKTTDGSLLFRCNLDVTQSDATKRDNAIKTMAEVRTLSVVTVGCHQHTKPGGKLVARRSRKALQSHRGALYLAAAAATAAAAAAEAGGGVKKRKLAAC